MKLKVVVYSALSAVAIGMVGITTLEFLENMEHGFLVLIGFGVLVLFFCVYFTTLKEDQR